jgi:hypothetical protein
MCGASISNRLGRRRGWRSLVNDPRETAGVVANASPWQGLVPSRVSHCHLTYGAFREAAIVGSAEWGGSTAVGVVEQGDEPLGEVLDGSELAASQEFALQDGCRSWPHRARPPVIPSKIEVPSQRSAEAWAVPFGAVLGRIRFLLGLACTMVSARRWEHRPHDLFDSEPAL